MKIIRAAALCIGILACLALAGCGSTANPKLRYNTVTGPADSCPATFTVVEFSLKGDDSQVGENSDGEGIYTDDDISLWVTNALKRELQANECRALVHDREYYPISDYVILGSVDKLWVKQESLTDYKTELTLTVTLKKDGKVVSTDTVEGSMDRTVMPGKGTVRDLLEESLQDVMRTVVAKVLGRADMNK